MIAHRLGREESGNLSPRAVEEICKDMMEDKTGSVQRNRCLITVDATTTIGNSEVGTRGRTFDQGHDEEEEKLTERAAQAWDDLTGEPPDPYVVLEAGLTDWNM